MCCAVLSLKVEIKSVRIYIHGTIPVYWYTVRVGIPSDCGILNEHTCRQS